jgi:hypothetical protein
MVRGGGIGSAMEVIFRIYGQPLSVRPTARENFANENRVLYQAPNGPAKIAYPHLGINFWFGSDGKCSQLVIYRGR